MDFDAAITIVADDFRLQIGYPEIDEAGIGRFSVQLDCLSGSFGVPDCVLWPSSDFAERLQALYVKLAGNAAFAARSSDFSMKFSSAGDGHVALKVTLSRRGASGEVAVSAETVIDQSYLPAIIAAWRGHFTLIPQGT
jgi:hypothetical protein